jgi:hypothetical protein
VLADGTNESRAGKNLCVRIELIQKDLSPYWITELVRFIPN